MVCDPFVGSQTIWLACRRLGRAFVGDNALDREDCVPCAKIARSVYDAPSAEDHAECPEGASSIFSSRRTAWKTSRISS